MLEFLGEHRAAIVSLNRTTMRRASQQQADFRLLALCNQERAHRHNSDGESIAPNLPSIGRAPLSIIDVGAAEWSPDIAAGNLATPIQQDAVSAARGKLRVYVYPLLGDDLKCPLAFDEAGEPRPFWFSCHAGSIARFNPEYAEMARRRIEGDAPLFAEVVNV